MPSFSWLHLTDLHWGLEGQRPLWSNVREAFFDDLEKLHERSGPWQAVLFTGDFVQQGKKNEFEQLDQRVLNPLRERLQRLGSGDAALLAVPGNHDLIRPDATKASAALKWLLSRTSSRRSPTTCSTTLERLPPGALRGVRRVRPVVGPGAQTVSDPDRRGDFAGLTSRHVLARRRPCASVWWG
jgi:hypothetical protein